jgi:hypothetical protein
MTRDEWAALVTRVDAWWPGNFTPDDRDAWFDVLGDFDREAVTAALKAALRQSPKWRPAAGEVLAILEPEVEAAATPTWAEARAALFGPRGVVRTSITRGDEAALERAGEVHPYLLAYCQAAGLRRLAMEEVDGDHGGAVIKRLGDEWADHCRRCDERIAVGRSLEPMGRSGELQRLDPLAALRASMPLRLVEGG